MDIVGTILAGLQKVDRFKDVADLPNLAEAETFPGYPSSQRRLKGITTYDSLVRSTKGLPDSSGKPAMSMSVSIFDAVKTRSGDDQSDNVQKRGAFQTPRRSLLKWATDQGS